MPRPCKLQINSTGAWRDVLRFDIDQVDSVALMDAASNLLVVADPDGKATLRIATADTFQHALTRWDAEKGWVDA
jgi:hypothetical protein